MTIFIKFNSSEFIIVVILLRTIHVSVKTTKKTIGREMFLDKNASSKKGGKTLKIKKKPDSDIKNNHSALLKIKNN